jgi:2-polyprenyl-3-methyl-5-hydroxy-6-metoxy-1,4-benzoquinol methylase
MTKVTPVDVSRSGGRLTTPKFWDSGYQTRTLAPFDDQHWRSRAATQVVRTIQSLGLDGKSICEVGGGDAQITCYLARHHPRARFSVLDFSPLGCDLARRRAAQERVQVDVMQADLLAPPDKALGRHDLVLSLGVVEHFTDLVTVLQAKARLVRPTGQLFTLIPNIGSPVYSRLCKRWSHSVFEDHVPHRMQSLLEGHRMAGLHMVRHGYLGALEFGMLSAAMQGPERRTNFDRQVFLWLTRLSTVIHYIEERTIDFPATSWLAPYLYVVSRTHA